MSAAQWVGTALIGLLLMGPLALVVLALVGRSLRVPVCMHPRSERYQVSGWMCGACGYTTQLRAGHKGEDPNECHEKKPGASNR